MSNYSFQKFLNLCVSKNVNPSTVARDIGISKSLISRWKNGGGLSDLTANKICNYFNVELLDLESDENEHISNVHDSVVIHGSAGDNNVINSSSVKTEMLSELESEVIRILRSCDMRTKNDVLTYLYEIEDGKKVKL